MKWFARAVLVVSMTALPTVVGAQQEPAEAETAAEEQAEAPADYELEGTTLVVSVGEEQSRVDLPCEGRDVAASGERVYVACGEAGVFVVSVADPGRAEGLGLRHLGGPVTELFVQRGRVWAQIERVEARPVEDAAPGGPAAAPAPAPQPATPEPAEPAEPSEPAEPADDAPAEDKQDDREPAVGEVVELRSANVVISLGAEQGIARGQRVELFVREDVGLGGDEDAVRERSLAVGRVSAVSKQRAEVELGINERVPKGALARPTSKELTDHPHVPPRLGDIWDVEFMARPFLALGTLGAGSVGSLKVTRRFAADIAAQLNINPLSFGIAEEGNVLAVGADANAAYDTRVFSIGLGAGAFSVTPDGTTHQSDPQRVAFGLTQVARLGARDGTHLDARNAFVLVDDEFAYGGTDVAVQVPIGVFASDTWFIMRGGGHISGDTYGEIGLRVLVRGNGDRGSIFVTPTLGGAALHGSEEVECPTWEDQAETCYERRSYGGPMVGFGMEWRL
jgi:hypothetical protein